MQNPNELFINDYEQETATIVKFIRNYFAGCPRKKVIFGLSGGLDSAVCAELYCRALGPENVYVVMMPAPNSSETSRNDAYAQIKKLGVSDENIYYRPLEKELWASQHKSNNDFIFLLAMLYLVIVKWLSKIIPISDTFKKANLQIGNTAARTRMKNLFKLADEVGAIVSGTENKTEYLLGYFTIGGDAVSIIEPIHHLYKWEVRKLAEHLGVIPEIRNKKPSAELWNGQTDEGELGFSYHDADVTLSCRERGKNPDDYGVYTETAQKVIARMNYSEFKRRLPVHMER